MKKRNLERLLKTELEQLVARLNMMTGEWPDDIEGLFIFVEDGVLVVEEIYEAEAEEVFSDDDSENPFGVLPWRSE